MTTLPMSRAASSVLRTLLDRAGSDRNRILLTQAHSRDWHSLTFSGERHQLRLRVTGAGAQSVIARITEGLDDVEFDIPGQFVADINAGPPFADDDAAMIVSIEALTIRE